MRYIVPVMLLAATVSFAEEDKVYQLPISIKGTHPKASLLSYAAELDKGVLIEIEDKPSQRFHTTRSLQWQRRILANKFLDKVYNVFWETDNPFSFLSNVGPLKDDMCLLKHSQNDRTFYILDGRIFMLHMEGEGIKEMSIAELVASYLKTPNKSKSSDPQIKLLKTEEKDGVSFGSIVVTPDAPIGTLRNIEWYREGNAVVFCLEKVGNPPFSKIPFSKATSFISGGLVTNPTPYRCFSSPTFKTHAWEIFTTAPEYKDVPKSTEAR